MNDWQVLKLAFSVDQDEAIIHLQKLYLLKHVKF